MLTYHPAFTYNYKILRKVYYHAHISPRLAAVFIAPPHLTLDSKTLKEKDVLERSKLSAQSNKENSVPKCLRPNCQVCPYLTNDEKFESTVTKKQYAINFPVHCNSMNVIYSSL